MQRSVSNILRRLAKQAVSKDAQFSGSSSIEGPLCMLRDAPSGLLSMLRAAPRKGLRERSVDEISQSSTIIRGDWPEMHD
jgi:hypothetical protein